MNHLFTDLARSITGQMASTRHQRLVQRALAIGALVGMITLLGPAFGYGLMAVLGVFVMIVASPEKRGISND